MALKLKKNQNLLLACVAVAAILVILSAGLVYLYLDDQNRQNQKREELKQAFSDQRNETERMYALIGSYPAAGNKNNLDDYQKWVAGYRQLANNYSQAARALAADGAAYQVMLANDSSDYADVTGCCNEARNRAGSINGTATGYEKDYQTLLGLKDTAKADYEQAVSRSHTLFDTAWNLMQNNSIFERYGGYLKYLQACDQNNSFYNTSIGLVESTGVAYQAYLKGSEHYAINTTISGLQDDSARLGKRYLELQKTKVVLTLLNEEVNTAVSADKGLYKSVTFYVQNENRKNGTLPARAWNIVVHYKLIDKATGAVRSTCDVNVPEFSYNIAPDGYTAILPCDQNREYDTIYTITCEY